MELWHLCLIVATHETSIAMRKASLNFAPGKKWQSKTWEKPACAVRVRSEHDPTMAPRMNGSVRSPTTEVILRAEQAHFLENYNISRSGYHSKFHNSSAPATKSECATWMQLYQMLRLARKPAVVLLLYYFLTLLFFDPTSLLLYYSFTLLLFCSAIFLTPKSLFFTPRYRSYVGKFSTKFPLITGLIILSVKYENPNEPTSKGIQQV